jgi:hypothetical protein
MGVCGYNHCHEPSPVVCSCGAAVATGIFGVGLALGVAIVVAVAVGMASGVLLVGVLLSLL